MDTVLATMRERDRVIRKGTLLFRAQQGIRWDSVHDEEGNFEKEEPIGFGRKRMKPLENRAKEGRVNPMGIPVLYLASKQDTAVSEVRPWIGATVSLSQFEVGRDLKVVDVSVGHGKTVLDHLKFSHIFGKDKPTAEEKEKMVWIEIDCAFSHPVLQSDDRAEYVPTQILGELFRGQGYDGIIYRSQFGEQGFNVALFRLDDAEPINGIPIEVKGVDIRFEQMGNAWSSKLR